MQIELEKAIYNGNEHLLWQVWVNMIGNALKFTPHGGRIEVRLFQDDSNCMIQRSDTGCGMDESVQRHIFDKFYQADTTRKSEGNGLGLALAKRIVDLCNGEIMVESAVDEGSTFTILLPK